MDPDQPQAAAAPVTETRRPSRPRTIPRRTPAAATRRDRGRRVRSTHHQPDHRRNRQPEAGLSGCRTWTAPSAGPQAARAQSANSSSLTGLRSGRRTAAGSARASGRFRRTPSSTRRTLQCHRWIAGACGRTISAVPVAGTRLAAERRRREFHRPQLLTAGASNHDPARPRADHMERKSGGSERPHPRQLPRWQRHPAESSLPGPQAVDLRQPAAVHRVRPGSRSWTGTHLIPLGRRHPPLQPLGRSLGLPGARQPTSRPGPTRFPR